MCDVESVTPIVSDSMSESPTTSPTSPTSPPPTSSPVFRFKLDPSLCSDMAEFARIHRHDSRPDFREHFDDWYVAQHETIGREADRLESIGYTADLKVKLFRSIKYYYMKRDRGEIGTRGEIGVPNNTHPTRPTKYIQLDRDFAADIVDFITLRCVPSKTRPKDGYTAFLDAYAIEVETEVSRIVGTHDLTVESATTKIKKTFKNCYFQVNKRANNNNNNNNVDVPDTETIA